MRGAPGLSRSSRRATFQPRSGFDPENVAGIKTEKLNPARTGVVANRDPLSNLGGKTSDRARKFKSTASGPAR